MMVNQITILTAKQVLNMYRYAHMCYIGYNNSTCDTIKQKKSDDEEKTVATTLLLFESPPLLIHGHSLAN